MKLIVSSLPPSLAISDKELVQTAVNSVKLPLVTLDVVAAPIVTIVCDGEIVDSTDITKTYFKDTLDTWGESYSLLFPSTVEWEIFWSTWKDII
jgi:hypothetical protein